VALQGSSLDDFTPTDDVQELQIVDLVEGSGEAVADGGVTITAHYTGALAASGIIFQSSHDFGKDGISFPLSGVIAGWTEGVPGMKVGGKRRLVIPAEKAYGSRPPYGSGIPADAPLVFDIELLAINS